MKAQSNLPELSVLTVSFNCWQYLNSCIRSVYASNYPVREIIVVDNASTDGTVQKLQATFPDVLLIQNSTNVGHAKAINQGFMKITGNRILVLDADTELEANAIGYMSAFLDEHPKVCVVAPQIRNSSGSIQLTSRNFPSAMNGLFGRQSIMTRLIPNNRFSKRYLNLAGVSDRNPFPVQQVSAACMMFPKNHLDTVGLWDSGYSNYWVDTDWCKRIQKNGGSIYCVPQAAIIHHEQNNRLRKKSPRRIIDFHTGAYRFYRIHYTKGFLDPRSIAAAFLLSARAVILIVINAFKK